MYLVTGGAGFIGSHIVEELVRRGEPVRVLDNLSTGRLENLSAFIDRVDFVEGDFTDLETVRRVMEGIEYVLHEGALPSVPRSIDDPLASNEANATGTLNVLVAARDAGAKRVVYASSSSVYGNTPGLPRREDMATAPMSPYAVSKLAGENYCRAFSSVYGLPTICLRYFNVFGPRQDPTSQYAAVIPIFVTRLRGGKPPVIFGDGLQSRDFTYVSNVVAANMRAVHAPPTVSGVFNASCGERYTLLELVELLNGIMGTDLAPILDEPRPGDVLHSQADISRAREMLGYEPSVSFEDGLRVTVGWFLGS